MEPRKRAVWGWESLGTGLIVLMVLISNQVIEPNDFNWMPPVAVGLAMLITFDKSGAHLNPLATGLVKIFSKHSLKRSGFYVLSEISGMAIALGIAVTGGLAISRNLPALDLSSAVQIVVYEIIASTLLLSLISTFIIIHRAKLLIMLVPILISVFWFTPLQASQMNPVVTLGLLLAANMDLPNALAHWCGQAIAMAIMFAAGGKMRQWHHSNYS